MRVGLIIFDCDGVIADSEVLSAEVLISELAKLEIAVTMQDVQRDFLGRSFPAVAAAIRKRFDQALPPEFEITYRDRLMERFATDLAPTPGIMDMLQTLDRPACVATSSSPPRVSLTLQVLGLTERFGPHVFTASQVAYGKPAPDLFLFAAAEMGCDPERALVIEDSAAGLEAAHAARMRVLHYRGGLHLVNQPATSGSDSFDDWSHFSAHLAQIEATA